MADCGVVGRRREVGGEAGVVRADSSSRTESPSLLSLSAIFKPLNMRSNWEGVRGLLSRMREAPTTRAVFVEALENSAPITVITLV